MKKKIISGLGIGLILHWLSLFLSYRELPNTYEDITKPIATGGFPFKTFEYPVPPMGSDWPPSEMWPMFFLNLAIWIIIGLLVAFILNKKITNEKIFKVINILAILMTLNGLLYIMLKFD